MKLKQMIVTALLIGLGHMALAAPATLVQSVTYNSETITMRLTQEALRGANFGLWAQNASGGYDVITPVAERSYIGTVDEYPDAISCGILQDDGTFRGAVYFDRGVTWRTLGSAVEGTQALSYAPGTFTSYQIPGAPTVSAGQGGTTTYGFDLGIDAEYTYYSTPGNSSTAKTFELIEYNIALTRAQYMRDALLRPYLGRIIIRTDETQDPYNGLAGGTYLDAVRTHWNANHTDANSDLVAGVSLWSVGGGLAWVGVVGTSSGYSVNDSGTSGSFDVVFRHEMGHNWNCGHYVGGSPEGTGFMGGNGTGRFSGCEIYRVLNHRNNKVAAGGILDDEGTYTAIELPPYASMDTMEFIQTVTSSLSLDVTANDHDANGQAISLLSFDGTSANGGTVTQQGQNLVYTAPGAFLGMDYFHYTITDTAGQTATGVVIIDVRPNDVLRAYLPLDETTGTEMADKSVFNSSGWAQNGATVGVAGQFGNAVSMDGTDDKIDAYNLNLNSDTVTLAAWINRPASSQNPWAGIIFNGAGLNFGEANELRYHWNGTNWGWNSGLTPAANQWVFVALVIEPTQATIYMHDGSTLQSAVHVGPHSPQAFSGTTAIGADPNRGDRNYTGSIDDVRIYSEALTQSQILDLVNGGSAEAPLPLDGGTDVTSQTLQWSAGANATANEVYVGTSLSAVTAATTASPEYQGSTPDAFFLATLADATTYYWRVDTVTSAGTLTGTVWSFTTGTVVVGDGILVNFQENSNQNFAGGQLIGPTSKDSSNWNSVLGASGTANGLTDNVGNATGVDIQWASSTTWYNSDGIGDDEHKLATGYLDDGNSGTGKGATVTLSNIPYANYKVYGLFTTDQNQGSGGSTATVNFNVNGSWALGGDASTTAATWGTIEANNTANGSYWTEIVTGSVQGNYWTVETSGSTCSIVGEVKNGTTRGCLTAVIIEEISGGNSAPTWNSNPVNEINATEDVVYSSTLANDATDADSDPLTFSKVSGPSWLSVAASGTLSGTPANGDIGSNSWTVDVSDGVAAPVQATLNITVDAAPDTTPPTAPTALGATAGDGVVDLDWADNTEPDLDSYTVYRSTTSGSGYASIATGLSSSDYADGTAVNGTTYYYVVTAVDTSANESANSSEVSATPEAPSGPTTDFASSESTALGTVSGSIADTVSNNDTYEVITEVESGGNPNRRRSQLEHTWTFNVTGGELVTFYVEAHHTVNSEGDDFIFAYSTDNVNFTDMVTVTKTADDNTAQFYSLPGSLSGTVYVRVLDTDRSQGNRVLDSIHVDALFITSESASTPPGQASSPAPTDGATGVSLTPTLTWTAGTLAASHDVYFGTNPTPGAGEFQGNQSGTSFAPGTLATGTTYYWAVDEVNGAGTTAGLVWSFTTGAGTPEMHVDAIMLSTQRSGKNHKGRATITIVDSSSGLPVSGATVSGDFTGVFSESGSAVTDAAGEAVITTSAKAGLPFSFTFTVTDVTASGYNYNAANNVETSDSGSF